MIYGAVIPPGKRCVLYPQPELDVVSVDGTCLRSVRATKIVVSEISSDLFVCMIKIGDRPQMPEGDKLPCWAFTSDAAPELDFDVIEAGAAMTVEVENPSDNEVVFKAEVS